MKMRHVKIPTNSTLGDTIDEFRIKSITMDSFQVINKLKQWASSHPVQFSIGIYDWENIHVVMLNIKYIINLRNY